MKLRIRPLLPAAQRPACKLGDHSAEFHAVAPGLGDFYVCRPCIDKPEKPAGHSFMQRFLVVHGGVSFFGGRHQEMQEVFA